MPLFGKSHKNPAEIVKTLKDNLAVLVKQDKKTEKVWVWEQSLRVIWVNNTCFTIGIILGNSANMAKNVLSSTIDEELLPVLQAGSDC